MQHYPATAPTVDDLLSLRHRPLERHLSIAGADHTPGTHPGPQRGQGLDFHDLRHYTPGDDVRHIDWQVTARQGEPWTRRYRQDNEQTLLVAVDLRARMFTGSTRLRAASAAMLSVAVLWQACHRGNRSAVMIITDDGSRISKPRRGPPGPVAACRDIARLFANQPGTPASRYSQDRQCKETSGPDVTGLHLSDALQRVAGLSAHYSTALLISALDDCDEQDWRQLANRFGRKPGLRVAMLLDPMERSPLPAGRYSYLEQPAGDTAPDATGGMQHHTDRRPGGFMQRLARLGPHRARQVQQQIDNRVHAQLDTLARYAIPATTIDVDDTLERQMATLDVLMRQRSHL